MVAQKEELMPNSTRYKPNYEMVEQRIAQTGAVFGDSGDPKLLNHHHYSPLYIKDAEG